MQHTVYIKTDSSNRITEINSSAFISDFSGWIEVDRGEGDRYHHAQGNYLSLTLRTLYLVANYFLRLHKMFALM